MRYLLAYIFAGIILNTMIDLRFVDRSGAYPKLDALFTFLLFKLFWPVGLFIFVVKWYQGKASIS